MRKFVDAIGSRRLAIIIVIIPVAAQFLLHVSNIRLPEERMSSDYAGYYRPLALALKSGHGYSHHGQAFSDIAPGTPLLLAGVMIMSDLVGADSEIAAMFIWSLMLGLAASLLFSIVSARHGLAAGAVVALLWLCYPLTMALLLQPLSEVPFILVLLLAVWLYIRSQPGPSRQRFVWVVLGATLMSATMVRPIALALPVVFIVHIFLSRRLDMMTRILRSALILVGGLIIVLPYMAWSGMYGDIKAFPGGNALPSIRDGLTFTAEKKEYREGILVPSMILPLIELYADRKDEMTSPAAVMDVVVENTTAYPIESLVFGFVKLARCLYATDSGNNEVLLAFLQVLFLTPMSIGVVRWWRLRSSAVDRPEGVVLLIFLHFWLMSFLVLSIVRYMLPAIGLLFLFLPMVFSRMNTPHEQVRHA